MLKVVFLQFKLKQINFKIFKNFVVNTNLQKLCSFIVYSIITLAIFSRSTIVHLFDCTTTLKP